MLKSFTPNQEKAYRDISAKPSIKFVVPSVCPCCKRPRSPMQFKSRDGKRIFNNCRTCRGVK